MNAEQEQLIRRELQGIVDRRFKALDSINIETLDFNPFLLKLLSLNTAKEIAEFMISQRTERGAVTSYGIRIQHIAKIISERGTGVEGADICKEKDGKRHYIQMKAGPNTPDKDIMQMINTLMKSAVRRNRGSVALLGMTYGKRERVSGIIQKYSEIDWLIGREFWSFISDDENCISELFEIIKDVADNYSPGGGMPYSIRYEEKVNELSKEIAKKYGKSGDEMWNKILEDNI